MSVVCFDQRRVESVAARLTTSDKKGARYGVLYSAVLVSEKTSGLAGLTMY